MKNISYFIIISFLFVVTGSAVSQEKKGDKEAGKIIFMKRCASCHGKTGEGFGPATKMPNFRDNKSMGTITDIQLFEIVTKGVKGTPMQPFEKVLSEEERWDAIAFIRSLSAE